MLSVFEKPSHFMRIYSNFNFPVILFKSDSLPKPDKTVIEPAAIWVCPASLTK